MIRVNTSTRPLTAHNTKCYAVCVEQDAPFGGILTSIEKSYVSGLQKLMVDANFSAAIGEKLVLPVVTDEGVVYVIVAGLGVKKGATIDIESYRRALGLVVKEVARLKADTLALALPDSGLFNVSDQFLLSKRSLC